MSKACLVYQNMRGVGKNESPFYLVVGAEGSERYSIAALLSALIYRRPQAKI